MRKEILKMFDGNQRKYKKPLPVIVILYKMNDVAESWIEKQTGMKLTKTHLGYTLHPKSSNQITRLLLTYNFMTRYYNNIDFKNTLFLKPCRDEDWERKTGNY